MSEIPFFCITAIATHLLMSFAQTLLHYRLGHRPLGGRLFKNHIDCHHVNYAKDHLVSERYMNEEGNNTPFFLIPMAAVALVTYFILPLELFVVQLIAMAASFYAHVYLDKQYHVAGSWLERFAWFRRKQQLHFVHHRHARSNFAVIDYFWDRLLGTYRGAETDESRAGAETSAAEPARAMRPGSAHASTRYRVRSSDLRCQYIRMP